MNDSEQRGAKDMATVPGCPFRDVRENKIPIRSETDGILVRRETIRAAMRGQRYIITMKSLILAQDER